MVKFKLKFTNSAKKDAKKLKKSNLKNKTQNLLEILKINPYKNTPPYEKLVGNLYGLYSRRINIQHRLVYQVLEKEKIVKVLSMWNHY
jgi:Txe/YoeB family toxin of toxin-antitoxin system